MTFKKAIKLLLPPIIFKFSKSSVKKDTQKAADILKESGDNPKEQNLDLYWNADYAKVLEEWGKESTWNFMVLIFQNY